MILTWPSQEKRNLYQKNLILTPPKKHFFKRKSFSHPPRFLYLSEKLISCTFPKKFWIPLYYFYVRKVMSATQKHQSLFICEALLFILIIYFFLYSTSLCFFFIFWEIYISFVTILPYCRFLFFFSSERSWPIWRAFFWSPSFLLY